MPIITKFLMMLFARPDKNPYLISFPMVKKSNLSKALFGAGCFWGVEEAFRKLKGVKNVTVGYAGGHTENPTYEDVCSHTTGHAEVAEVEYDPEEISYEEVLDAFWNMHNPTTFNRQGPDIGSQYRSVIFCTTKEQEKLAQKSKEALGKSGKWKNLVVTEIAPAPPFWRAEEYHQNYFGKGGLGACHI